MHTAHLLTVSCSAWGAGGVSQHSFGQTPLRQTPPGQTPPTLWTEFLTHACENITLPQLLLRAVIKCTKLEMHSQWKHCPKCHSWRRNVEWRVTQRFLTSTSNGIDCSVRTEIILACSKYDAFWGIILGTQLLWDEGKWS